MNRENLEGMALLKYISDDELKSFAYKPEIKSIKKGQIVFTILDEPNYMYIIVDGLIKISIYTSDGREQVLYTYGKGDFVGAHNLLTGENYIYEGKTLIDSKLIKIYKDDFKNILINNNKILIKILDQSFKRIRRSEELIDRLVGLNADMKVAKLLLDLADENGIVKKNGILVKIYLNREEMATYSGVVRETLSRKLSYFEQRGLIKIISRGKILITNIDALIKMTS